MRTALDYLEFCIIRNMQNRPYSSVLQVIEPWISASLLVVIQGRPSMADASPEKKKSISCRPVGLTCLDRRPSSRRQLHVLQLVASDSNDGSNLDLAHHDAVTWTAAMHFTTACSHFLCHGITAISNFVLSPCSASKSMRRQRACASRAHSAILANWVEQMLAAPAAFSMKSAMLSGSLQRIRCRNQLRQQFRSGMFANF